jgi:nicotinate-nucleotide adenylyltransferase
MLKQKKKIGLFFGSFNPVHVGHMIIANYMVTQASLDEVWMIVSPHNPLKDKASLAKDHDRLHLVKLAIGDNVKLKASNVEFALPKPSYTIDTLTYLNEKYPEYDFIMLMGGDSLATLHKWKNYELLLSNYQIYVYQRPTYELSDELKNNANVHIMEGTPMLDISASYVRECIKKGYSIEYLVPDKVYEYINGSNMYKS